MIPLLNIAKGFLNRAERIARAITSRYKVNVQVSSSGSYTDGANIYIDLHVGDYVDDKKTLFEGVLDHEVGHLLFTKFPVENFKAVGDKKLLLQAIKDKRVLPVEMGKKFLSAQHGKLNSIMQHVEDVRIQRRMGIYPGSVENLCEHEIIAFNLHAKKLSTTNKMLDYELLDRILIAVRLVNYIDSRYKPEYERIFEKFFASDDLVKRFMLDVYAKKGLHAKIRRLKETEDTILFSEEFFELYGQFIKQQKQQMEEASNEKQKSSKQKESEPNSASEDKGERKTGSDSRKKQAKDRSSKGKTREESGEEGSTDETEEREEHQPSNEEDGKKGKKKAGKDSEKDGEEDGESDSAEDRNKSVVGKRTSSKDETREEGSEADEEKSKTSGKNSQSEDSEEDEENDEEKPEAFEGDFECENSEENGEENGEEISSLPIIVREARKSLSEVEKNELSKVDPKELTRSADDFWETNEKFLKEEMESGLDVNLCYTPACKEIIEADEMFFIEKLLRENKLGKVIKKLDSESKNTIKYAYKKRLYSAYVVKLRRQLLQAFMQKFFSRSLDIQYNTDEETEQIDLREIAKSFSFEDYKVHFPFIKTVEGEKRKIAVSLLVDLSGSMRENNNVGIATDISIACAEAFRRLNIAFEVSGQNVPLSSFNVPSRVPMIGRLEPVSLYIFKTFEEDCIENISLMAKLAGGSNADGAAMQYSGTRLLRRNEDRKLFFYICDGKPTSCATEAAGAKEMQDMAQQMEKNKIEFYCIGVDTDAVEIFGPKKACLVVSDKNLGAELVKIITSKI